MTERNYAGIVADYVAAITSGEKVACRPLVQRCERYLKDRDRPDLEFRQRPRVARCKLIETTCVHEKGEALDGTPLRGKPLLLDDWEIFIIWNLWGFWLPGTNERRFKERFIGVPRKNGKTSLAGGLGWAACRMEAASGSEVLITAARLDQAKKRFDFLKFSLEQKGIASAKPKRGQMQIRDNSFEHSIKRDMGAAGSLYIRALANNPKKQDSFNCNTAILDEIQAFKTTAEYSRFVEAQAAYLNRLTVGITSAGDEINSFCYRHWDSCLKVLSGTAKQDSLFIFITMADRDASGYVDYTDPVQHEKANPGYGKNINPREIADEASKAELDPQKRKDFLSRRLNIYTSASAAYFNLQEFKNSDGKYTWTLDELAKMRGVKWYGGADLSRMHDLTAAVLVGNVGGVDVIIPHVFFPRAQRHAKATEDNIPLFGWEADGWLTMSNTPTVNYSDVVGWFLDMERQGFKIAEVGYDRQYAAEFIEEMLEFRFNMVEQPQYHRALTPSFRRIEKSAKDGTLYYLHAEPFEYAVENVKAIEKQSYIAYDKTGDKHRIDPFDRAVFAMARYLESTKGSAKKERINNWFKPK